MNLEWLFYPFFFASIAIAVWIYNNFGQIMNTIMWSDRFARTSLIRTVTAIYSIVWILIFMFPPQYNVIKNSSTSHFGFISSTTYRYDHSGDKFVFIMNSDKLDYALAAFEIIGWAMIGFMIYFVWIRPYHTKLYKDLCEEREVLILARGGI